MFTIQGEAAQITVYGKGGATTVHSDGTTTVTVCPEQCTAKCLTIEINIKDLKLLSIPPGLGIEDLDNVEIISLDLSEDENGYVGSNLTLWIR